MTTDPNPRRVVLTVTATSRPDGGHYFDQADFTGHVTEWVRAALKGKHAVDEVTIVDQAAELARAQAEAHQYRTALQGVARREAVSSSGRAALLREAANSLAALGPMDSLVSAPTAWDEAVTVLRQMADDAEAADGPRRVAAEEQPAETQDGGRVKAIADAIGPNMLFGLQDAELLGEPGQERIRDWIKWISETVAALPVERRPVVGEQPDTQEQEAGQ